MSSYNNFTSFLSASFKYDTIPIYQSFFLDTVTPIKAYQQFQEEATFLLESKDDSSTWNRYSFIGLHPFLSIEGRETLQIIGKENSILHDCKTIQEAFQYSLNLLKVAPLSMEIPFLGGAVGYISYDYITTLEKVSSHPKCQNENLVNLQFCETVIVLDHKTNMVTIIYYIRLKGTETKLEKESLYQKGKAEINRCASQLNKKNEEEMFVSVESDEQSPIQFQSSYTKEIFIQHVDIVKNYIRQGDIFQCVLAQKFSIELDIDGFDVYRVLRNVNPSPYLFYIKLSDRELIGSSPERLVEVKDRILEIHPIAGTRRRGKTKEDDERMGKELLSDKKEQAEHVMLVDLARNDIGKVAKFGSVHVSEFKKLVYFSKVMHIISIVKGELEKTKSPLDALLATFPAGTVSGAPKVRAMQIIQELEPVERNTYAGAICYIGFDGNIDSCITIRTIEKKKDTFQIQAGAGIVADSIPELEWKETNNKAKALLETLQIANQLFQKEKRG